MKIGVLFLNKEAKVIIIIIANLELNNVFLQLMSSHKPNMTLESPGVVL